MYLTHRLNLGETLPLQVPSTLMGMIQYASTRIYAVYVYYYTLAVYKIYIRTGQVQKRTSQEKQRMQKLRQRNIQIAIQSKVSILIMNLEFLFWVSGERQWTRENIIRFRTSPKARTKG